MSGIELRLNMASYKDNVDMIVSTLEAAFNKSNNTLPFWDRVPINTYVNRLHTYVNQSHTSVGICKIK